MSNTTTPTVNIAILSGLFVAGGVEVKGKATANSKANLARLNRALAALAKDSEYDSPETKKFASKLAKAVQKDGQKVTEIVVDEAGEQFSLTLSEPVEAAAPAEVPTEGEAKPNKQPKLKKPVKASKPFVSKPVNIPGVRPTRSRPFLAGVVIAKRGIEKGVTEEIVKEVDALYVEGGNATNLRETRFSCRNAWAAIRGFQNGDDVNKGLEMTKAPTKNKEADTAAE